MRKDQATVTSQTPNDILLRLVYTEGNRKRSANVKVLDVPGHGHFKQTIQQKLPETKAIIVVVDSANRYA